MKVLLLSLLVSLPLYAHYGKPQLLAMYAADSNINMPFGVYCFGSEPQPTTHGVYLACQDSNGFMMARWNPDFGMLARTESNHFSKPVSIGNRVSWHEFNELGLLKVYEMSDRGLKAIVLKNLGPLFSQHDSFLPIKENAYVYRLEDETKTLGYWKDQEVKTLFNETVSHIFPPVTSADGNFLIKIRKDTLNENAPDELLMWDGEFKSILKDRDADPTSRWKSFRHQFAIDGKQIAFIAQDDAGEALFLYEEGELTLVARAGTELLSFDYFNVKLRNGVLVFRGVDQNNLKSVYVFQNNELKKLLTQKDLIVTPQGTARVDYESQDAVFYGAPGIGPQGEIVLQATLMSQDANRLLGVSILTFSRE